VLSPVFTTRFRRDVKRAERRGKDMAKLKAVIALLAEQAPLPPEYRDHPLRGDWTGYRAPHNPTGCCSIGSMARNCGLPEPDGIPTFSTSSRESSGLSATEKSGVLLSDPEFQPIPTPNVIITKSSHPPGGLHAGFKLPMAGDVTQTSTVSMFFNPVGGQVGLINVNFGTSSEPKIETQVLSDVASYGKQIDRIGDALVGLVRHFQPVRRTHEGRKRGDPRPQIDAEQYSRGQGTALDQRRTQAVTG
jgi:mRNA-degrading endonuclease YafQ of YafQ-DinJ toxin-antitoxin module